MATIDEFIVKGAIRVRDRGIALLLDFAELDGRNVISLVISFSDWDSKEIVNVGEVYPNGFFIQGDIVKLKEEQGKTYYPWIVKEVYDDYVKVIDARRHTHSVYTRRLRNLSYISLPLSSEPDDTATIEPFNVFW